MSGPRPEPTSFPDPHSGLPPVLAQPRRPLYRTLAFLTGVGLAAFGGIGMVTTSGMAAFDQSGTTVLGLGANPAFAWLSVLVGLTVALVALVGRNVDATFDVLAGLGFLAAGLVALSLLGTGANVLAFTMTNVVVSFAIGTLLLAAGVYGRITAPGHAGTVDVPDTVAVSAATP